jgi:hypothetical protein
MGLDSTEDGYVHEKWAVFTDTAGNRIYISGSLNGSRTALVLNAENIDVHCDWWNELERQRVEEAQEDFQTVWEDRSPYLRVMPLPEAVRKRLIRFAEGMTAPVEVDQTPLRTSLADLGPLRIDQVRRTDAEPLLNGLIETHHYLGYTQPVGEQLKFLVWTQDRPIACFTWSSAPRHLAPRDRFIGWSAQARKRNIRFVAYNSRFLILPWVEVPHLASHLLGRMCRMLPAEWERVYGHPVHFAETFVYPARFRGTCYRAANWIFMGRTTGRGKASNSHQPNRPLKDVLGYPLTRRFRRLLGEAG